MASLQEEMGKSVFLETFGDSPINRVLDFLIVFDKFDYSMADIAEKAGVGYSTLKILIHELVKKKLLAQTRVSGKSKMYRLNKDNLLVKRFVDFYWSITNEAVGKERLKVVVSR
ncbi:MAG TPA: hypothetical protein VJG90_05835 [Candidatus Nanoarchaeia archaeon]|nr:hypothetical protein [Candidatus Nanoarchaeia archaeon]